MSDNVIRLTFRVVRMPTSPSDPTHQYVGIAWNYDYGQLVATPPADSYTVARALLDVEVRRRKPAKLAYFDGEYVVEAGATTMVQFTADPFHLSRFRKRK